MVFKRHHVRGNEIRSEKSASRCQIPIPNHGDHALKKTPPAKTKCRYLPDDLRSDGSTSPGFDQCNGNRGQPIRLHVESCEADLGDRIDGFDGADHMIFRVDDRWIPSRVLLLRDDAAAGTGGHDGWVIPQFQEKGGILDCCRSQTELVIILSHRIEFYPHKMGSP